MAAISRMQTRRTNALTPVTLTTSLATTPEIPFEEWSQGSIYIPAGSPITTLTFNGAPFQSSSAAEPSGQTETQTYLPIFTQANAAVTLTVAAGRSYSFPTDCAGHGAIKITVNSAGAVELSLKG